MYTEIELMKMTDYELCHLSPVNAEERDKIVREIDRRIHVNHVSAFLFIIAFMLIVVCFPIGIVAALGVFWYRAPRYANTRCTSFPISRLKGM